MDFVHHHLLFCLYDYIVYLCSSYEQVKLEIVENSCGYWKTLCQQLFFHLLNIQRYFEQQKKRSCLNVIWTRSTILTTILKMKMLFINSSRDNDAHLFHSVNALWCISINLRQPTKRIVYYYSLSLDSRSIPAKNNISTNATSYTQINHNVQ